MKIIKTIKILILLAVLGVVGAVGGTCMYIDNIAKYAIEKAGTFALGVATTIDDIRIGLLSGSVTLAELKVANPEGFDTPHFMNLGEGRVAASLGTLRADTVELPELRLSGIDMNLEKKGGKANYDVILTNLKSLGSGKKQEEPAAGGGKKFVIREVDIRDINVTAEIASISGKPKRIPVKIKSIELKNVGTGTDGGVVMSELSGIVVQAILTAVVKSAGKDLPDAILGELTTDLKPLGNIEGATLVVAGEVTSMLESGAAQVEKGLEDVGNAIEGGANVLGKSMEEGLGGLLGTKKDEKSNEKKTAD